MGGYMSCLLGSVLPERVKALFLLSAYGMEAFDPEEYHPTTYNSMKDPSKLIDTAEVEEIDQS